MAGLKRDRDKDGETYFVDTLDEYKAMRVLVSTSKPLNSTVRYQGYPKPHVLGTRLSFV